MPSFPGQLERRLATPWRSGPYGGPARRAGNQVVTPTRRYLVDWESLKLAPKERDLRLFVDLGHHDALGNRSLNWNMIEMFDLEWRLDEISQYATWFAAPHGGTASDAVAYGGLLHELERPDWSPPP